MKTIIVYFVLFIPILTFSQASEKDTLFLKYDPLFLKKIERMEDDETFYFIKGTGNSGTLLLKIDRSFHDLKPKKAEEIEEVLKKSNAYFKKDQLNDYRLGNYLKNFVIFIIEDKRCNLVNLVFEIE